MLYALPVSVHPNGPPALETECPQVAGAVGYTLGAKSAQSLMRCDSCVFVAWPSRPLADRSGEA